MLWTENRLHSRLAQVRVEDADGLSIWVDIIGEDARCSDDEFVVFCDVVVVVGANRWFAADHFDQMVFDFAASGQPIREGATSGAQTEPRRSESNGRVGRCRDKECVRTCNHRFAVENLLSGVFEVIILVPVDPCIDKACR